MAEMLIVNTPSEGLNGTYHLMLLLLLLLLPFCDVAALIFQNNCQTKLKLNIIGE